MGQLVLSKDWPDIGRTVIVPACRSAIVIVYPLGLVDGNIKQYKHLEDRDRERGKGLCVLLEYTRDHVEEQGLGVVRARLVSLSQRSSHSFATMSFFGGGNQSSNTGSTGGSLFGNTQASGSTGTGLFGSSG